jgi:hypothetical protein
MSPVRLLSRSFLVFALLTLVGGHAAADPTLKAKPVLYDPGELGIASAAWVTQQGLPDAGGSQHALYLAKQGDTSEITAGIVVIDGVEGLTLTELGFDVRDDGHCGAGAPRFNVRISTGDLFFFGCFYGTHTPLAGGWTQVRFGNGDAFHQFGTVAWPGFGNAIVTSIAIVFDEGTDTPAGGTIVTPGAVYLDNIDVNGILIGKPGNAN